MSKSRAGSNRYLWIAGIAVLIAVASFFTPLPMLIGISMSMRKVRDLEARLLQAEIYLPVATNLARYCQSCDELHLTGMVEGSRLPQPLPSLGSPRAFFLTNMADVEFGGGFYHYGYRVQLDENRSTPEANVWKLFLCREGQQDKLLHHFALPSGDRVSVAEFINGAIAEYDQQLAKSPRDLNFLTAKISLLVQHQPQDVRAACVRAIEAAPDLWWPRLTLAMVDSGKGKHAEATSELVKFTESKPSYSRYLYLAYFYQLNGKPQEAAKAVEKAISFPIIDLSDDQINTEGRRYSAGVYAFQSGEYETAIKLCEALLPVQANGNYAKDALRHLKSAADAASKGARPDSKPSDEIGVFNPYQGMDIEKLFSK